MKKFYQRFQDQAGNQFVPASAPLFDDVETAGDWAQDNGTQWMDLGVQWNGPAGGEVVGGEIVLDVVKADIVGVGEVWVFAGPLFEAGSPVSGFPAG